IDKISTVPKDSSAYHTGMMDVSDRALLIKTNIMDATPYMYVSIANLMFTVVWIAALLGIFAALKRKKDQLKETDDIGV
ncbi:MAG: glycosyl transferase, partial [Nitrosopumilus sp.]